MHYQLVCTWGSSNMWEARWVSCKWIFNELSRNVSSQAHCIQNSEIWIADLLFKAYSLKKKNMHIFVEVFHSWNCLTQTNSFLWVSVKRMQRIQLMRTLPANKQHRMRSKPIKIQPFLKYNSKFIVWRIFQVKKESNLCSTTALMRKVQHPREWNMPFNDQQRMSDWPATSALQCMHSFQTQQAISRGAATPQTRLLASETGSLG